jgi:hypothetical protein
MAEGETKASRIASLCKEIGRLKIQILTAKKNGEEAQQEELQAQLLAMLTEHTQLQQSQYELGVFVECRDSDSEEWQYGVVTSLQPLLVRPAGFTDAFEWDEVRPSKGLPESPSQAPREIDEHVAEIRREIQMAQDTDPLPDPEAETLSSLPTLQISVPERVESPLPFVESVANAVAAAEAACRRCGVQTPDSFRRRMGEEVKSDLDKRERSSPTPRKQSVGMQRSDSQTKQRVAAAKTSPINKSVCRDRSDCRDRSPRQSDCRARSVEQRRSPSRGKRNQIESQSEMSQLFETLNRKAQASSKEQKALEQKAKQLDKNLRSSFGAREERGRDGTRQLDKTSRSSFGTREGRAGVPQKKTAAELMALKTAFDARLQKLSDRDRSIDANPALQAPAVTPQRSRIAPSQRMQITPRVFDARGVPSASAARKLAWGSQLGPPTSKPGRVSSETRPESAKEKVSDSSGRCQKEVQSFTKTSVSNSASAPIDNSQGMFVWRQHSIGSEEIDGGDEDSTSDHLPSPADVDSGVEQVLEASCLSSEVACEKDEPDTINDNAICQDSIRSSSQASPITDSPQVHSVSKHSITDSPQTRTGSKHSIALDMGPGTSSQASFVVSRDTELCTLPSTPACPPRGMLTIQTDEVADTSTLVHSNQLRNALKAVVGEITIADDPAASGDDPSASEFDPIASGDDLADSIARVDHLSESNADDDSNAGDMIPSGGDADGGGGSPLFRVFPQRWTADEPNVEVSAPPMSWGTSSLDDAADMEREERGTRETYGSLIDNGESGTFSAMDEARVESIAAAATSAAFASARQASPPLRRQWSPPPARILPNAMRSGTSVTAPVQIPPECRRPSPPLGRPTQFSQTLEEYSFVGSASSQAEGMEVPARQYGRSSSSGRASQSLLSRLCSHTASSQARHEEIVSRRSAIAASTPVPVSGGWQY